MTLWNKEDSNRFIAVFATGIFFLLCALLFVLRTQENTLPLPSPDALFLDERLSSEVRAKDLLSYMTLREKIGQMTLVEKNSIHNTGDIAAYGLGALLSGFGGKPSINTALGWKNMVEGFRGSAQESRLGIPLLYGADAIHGHTNVPEATVFPHAIALGATGNEELVEKIAQATARELAATGVNWNYAPNLDLPRDIRWGRVYETFSDDPVLASSLGSAYIRGLQNQADSTLFILSTPKHYVGLGAMVWESSTNENFKIDQGMTIANEALLRNEYLLPFKAAIDAGVKVVMVGLNSWDEVKLGASKYLITDVLKEELGFEGFAVSDWYGVYEIDGGDYRAAVTAINAGIDMVMLPFDYKPFIRNVELAVRRGQIEQERIDDAVVRILKAKFELGLFDGSVTQEPLETIGTPEHRALAREAVAESLVLLKNEDVFPLNGVKNIFVAGSAADNVGLQSGAWTVEWQGVDGNWLPNSTSILAGIREKAGEETTVTFSAKGEFDRTAPKADIGIAIVGERPYAEGWGDSERPSLSPEDLAVIEKVKAVSNKTIVIIVAGRPLFITGELPTWDALVMAWLPGSEGAGIADVLFGSKPFVGKLPLPWPRHTEQLPIARDGTTADGTAVLFPRYFGLK